MGRLNNPFDETPPALAREAAEALMKKMPEPAEGKMLGVLVAEDGAGQLVWLYAFSGMYCGSWDLDGFAPPIFNRALRASIEPAGLPQIEQLNERIAAAERSRDEAQEKLEPAEEEERLLRAKLAQKKADRDVRRARGEKVPELESQADSAELARAKKRWREGRAELEHRERELRASIAERRAISETIMNGIFDSYELESFSGKKSSLCALYDGKPPAGAGDCAAPKLLVAARRRGLKPRAIAEFWWGPPPPGGGRRHGQYYGACRDKCGPLLPFLLDGVEVDPPRGPQRKMFGPDLSIIYQDERVLAVDKPAGQPSVSAPDSIECSAKRLFPGATLVHRLDEDTSGVLLLALDTEAHTKIQRQFLHRVVRKKYLAWLEGQVDAEEGRIDLPLRPDFEQRPRQVVDFEHGKRARTRWQVLERFQSRTRVAFFPETGRTHQLRVHAAHPLGLNAPIAGDRLYGSPGARLMLHAEELWIVHPNGSELTLKSPSPF